MTITLKCFGESGNAYKAALALELSGLDWQADYVDFFAGQARSPEFRTENVMSEVPVMIDGDVILSQSGAIQFYITEKSGKFGGTDKAQEREVLRWILWDNHKLSSQAGLTRYLMNFLPEDKRPQEIIGFMLDRLKGAYATLNTALKGRDWLVGSSITNADMSCCGYLFYPEPFGFNRTDWPHIDAWLTRISDQPGWKHPYDLMPGSPADRA